MVTIIAHPTIMITYVLAETPAMTASISITGDDNISCTRSACDTCFIDAESWIRDARPIIAPGARRASDVAMIHTVVKDE